MDNIYIKLIPNEERAAANHPSWVAPINPKSPEGKKWKLGVKIGDTWYDPAGFDTTDENDQPTGGLTVRLVPSNSSKQSQGGSGGTPNFAYKKDFAKPSSYASNKQRRY